MIDTNMGLNLQVKKTVLNRTEMFLNDSILIESGLKMRSKSPNWLKKKSSRGNFINYSFSDIPKPYRLIKSPGSNDIFILKNNDTLKFSLSD